MHPPMYDVMNAWPMRGWAWFARLIVNSVCVVYACPLYTAQSLGLSSGSNGASYRFARTKWLVHGHTQK